MERRFVKLNSEGSVKITRISGGNYDFTNEGNDPVASEEDREKIRSGYREHEEKLANERKQRFYSLVAGIVVIVILITVIHQFLVK